MHTYMYLFSVKAQNGVKLILLNYTSTSVYLIIQIRKLLRIVFTWSVSTSTRCLQRCPLTPIGQLQKQSSKKHFSFFKLSACKSWMTWKYPSVFLMRMLIRSSLRFLMPNKNWYLGDGKIWLDKQRKTIHVLIWLCLIYYITIFQMLVILLHYLHELIMKLHTFNCKYHLSTRLFVSELAWL